MGPFFILESVSSLLLPKVLVDLVWLFGVNWFGLIQHGWYGIVDFGIGIVDFSSTVQCTLQSEVSVLGNVR